MSALKIKWVGPVWVPLRIWGLKSQNSCDPLVWQRLPITRHSLYLWCSSRDSLALSSLTCVVIQNSFFHSSPLRLFSSVLHRFCVERARDSVPLWGILGNKSNFCLHVEAHGMVLSHFFTQTNLSTKWWKVGQKSSRGAPNWVCFAKTSSEP